MFGAITLDTGGDTGTILIIAAIVGASASLVAELLVARGKAADTGVFERPRSLNARFYDLGSWASIPLGVLAACLAGLMLTPVEKSVEAGKTTESMALDNLIVVAAIAGLASASFLTVLADRFVAAMKVKGLDVALSDAITALKDLAEDPGAGASGATGGGALPAGPATVAARARAAGQAAEARRNELMGQASG
jgi:hypothetical protein